ncbi:MAG: hypothetical protein ACT4PP_09685 [Sporichthyaceae bacterium]
MPTANALTLVDRRGPIWTELTTDVGVRVHTTVLNGDYVEIPLDREADLRADLARHGIQADRNDALIFRLCP